MMKLKSAPVALAARPSATRRAPVSSAKGTPTTKRSAATRGVVVVSAAATSSSSPSTAEPAAVARATAEVSEPRPPVLSETATEIESLPAGKNDDGGKEKDDAAAPANDDDDAAPANDDDASSISEIIRLVTSAAAGTRGATGLSAQDAEDFDAAVSALENSPRRVRDPALSASIAGRWRLLFTSKPGTNSPIQQFFTGNDAFEVHQEVTSPVLTRGGEVSVPGSVTNVVTLLNKRDGTTIGTLRVLAATSTLAAPLPGFVPRKGPGVPLLKFLGTSTVAPPRSPGERLDFAFRRAAFYFSSGPLKGLSVPYPVPFEALSKLPGDLGDEVKGFLDTTYLSPDGRFRLSRGNKGTLFVLQRDEGLKRDLMSASELGWDASRVEAAAKELYESGAGERAPARSPLAEGRWRLLWSEQAPDAAPLQRALAGRVANWQVIGGGDEKEKTPSSSTSTSLKNVVGLIPGVLELWATATCSPASDSRTRVDIDGLELRAGPAGKIRLLRVDRNSRTESDTGPALFPKTRTSGARAAPTPRAKAKKASASGTKSAATATATAKRGKQEEENVGFVDWLYLDEDLRVTRGSKGSLFLHVRERE